MKAETGAKWQDAVYIASGSVHPQLAVDTATVMTMQAGPMERKEFPNTERYVRYGESVRGKHVFAMQSVAAVDGDSVNDAFMELVLMVDAARRASAQDITVVAPYLAYLRQDRKARGREPISAARIVKILQNAGANRIVSVDMHSPQTQGNFDGPFDHLTAEPLLLGALRERVLERPDEFIMVAPDAGRVKVTDHYSNDLGIGMAFMPKYRDRKDPSKITRPTKALEVEGKVCIMVDDMIDTAGTLASAAEALRRSGAKGVIVAATHGLFSGPALERLTKVLIDELIVTDTVPIDRAQAALGGRLHVVSIAPLLAQALEQIAMYGSVSEIFADRNYQ